MKTFLKKLNLEILLSLEKILAAGVPGNRQLIVFSALGIQAIIAESFGAIYERNAINAAFPVLTCKDMTALEMKNGDRIKVNLKTGKVENLQNNRIV